MDWLTMEEVAKYELIPIGTVWRKHSEGHYNNTRTEPPGNGGKDRVYIELSCLSKEAQARYKRHKKYIEKDFPRELKKRSQDYKPWFYDIDVPQYIEKYGKYFTKAATIAEICESYLENKPDKGIMAYNKCYCIKAGVSLQQFMRYVRLFRAGAEFGKIKSEETGGNYDVYKVIALSRPIHIPTNTKITPQMENTLRYIWSDSKYHQNRQTIPQLYKRFVDMMNAQGVTDVPSERTIRRYIDKVEYHNGNEKALLKGGERYFKNTAMVKAQRDIGQLKVMELVQADTHTFDCWVEYVTEDGEVTAIRPALIGFIDTRSRCLVSYGICHQPNSEILKQVVFSMIKPKANTPIYGVPKVLYIDNGKDFTAKELTGVNRKERYEPDDDLKGFYGMTGIREYKRALPYQPWTKGQIERVFGTITGDFAKRYASYTGTLTGSKTDGKVKKDIPQMLKTGKLPTMEQFAADFEEYINNEYHQREHSGLKKQHEPVPTPIAVYTTAERYFKAAPPDEYILSFLGKSEERNVNNVGIYLKGNTYTGEDLERYIGQRVKVRYNERDLTMICVYTLDNNFLCKAYKAELLHPLADADDELLEAHIKRQKRQLKTAKENIKDMQSAFVYGLELPEASDKERKVVSLPEGGQYERRAAGQNKPKAKKNPIAAKYMEEQSRKALRQIEELERMGTYE